MASTGGTSSISSSGRLVQAVPIPVPYSTLKNGTVGLLEVFGACNSQFSFDKSLNPRRVLTKPSRPAFNSGYDNEKHDYILYVNDVIGNEEGRK